MSIAALASRIAQHYAAPQTCLFAGAGVSAHAGLPTWSEYLDFLATVAEQYEAETAVLMRRRTSHNQLTEAAQLYKSCPEIPQGVMYEKLVEPFLTYDAARLRALMSLPNSAVVTTNFDRALHDAYQGLAPIAGKARPAALYAELRDVSLQQAIYWRKFFIARVHGRAEIPPTVVIATDDYSKLDHDVHYQDFLVHVFKNYHCLWLGFSFVDPAVQKVFDVIRRTLPQPYPRLHLAVLPNNADVSLRAKLHELNIDTADYDPRDQHVTLWEAIKLANRSLLDRALPVGERNSGVPGLQALVASSYARLRLGSGVLPLAEVVAEGVVAQAAADAGASGISRVEVHTAIKRHISVADEDLDSLVDASLRNVAKDSRFIVQGDRLTYSGPPTRSDFDAAIDKLADGAAARLKVREGVDATTADRKTMHDVIQRLIMSRGWDLGAHFARNADAEAFDAWNDIESALAKLVNAPQSGHNKALGFALFDLLRHPSKSEAELLADLGRISFAVELVTNNSRAMVGRSPLIPDTIYLDSNVLMPAIVVGHPYNRLYADTILRLQTAAAGVGRSVRVVVGSEFAREILAHKEIARATVRDLKLEDPVRLQQHILLYGAHRTNVFVGAYASRCGRGAVPLPFDVFLNEAAPYNSMDALTRYLNELGVEVVGFAFGDEDQRLFGDVTDALHAAYAADNSTKVDVLIDNEAKQLTKLLVDMRMRRGSLFVTADKTLMGYCHDRPLGKCANAMISHLVFVQLVDVLLGVSTDREALTRLLWNVGESDPRVMIRNYLIDRALSYYDEATAMAVWEVIDKISERAAQEAKDQGVKLFFGSGDLRQNAAFLDRFEEIFFEQMKAVIAERERRP